MIFWLGILFSIVFMIAVMKKGLYEIWGIFFNAVISVYLSIILSPIIADLLPKNAGGAFGDVLTLLCLAIGFFVLLHSILYILVLSQFRVNMGKLLDSVGAPILGFLLGFLLWSFILLAASYSPLTEHRIIQKIGLNSEDLKPNISYINLYAGVIESFTASKPINPDKTIVKIIDNLIKKHSQPKAETPEDEKIIPQDKYIETKEPDEPNIVQTSDD
ncbi:MAG: hypothetical protein WDA68_09825 [Phycisphaerae bacterium]